MKTLIDKLFGNKESPIGRDTKVERIGDYTVVRKIGAGGTSDVYLGLHTTKMATAAIKQLSLKRAAEAHQQMFVTESLLCGVLDHPNIIEMHAASLSDPAGAYLVMEYVDGCSLDQHEDVDTLLAVDTVVDVMLQAARALQYLAAEGVIHRDLKPGNILMRKDGQIKIADFGCAIIQGQPAAALRVAGSLPYMSPEQIAGDPLTHLSDMYSLGAVFYRLLTGNHPVDAHGDETPQSYAERVVDEQHVPIAQRRADLPPALAAAVMRMLAREPQQRYESWQAFLHKLQQLAAEGFRDAPEVAVRRGKVRERAHSAKPEADDYGLSFGW